MGLRDLTIDQHIKTFHEVFVPLVLTLKRMVIIILPFSSPVRHGHLLTCIIGARPIISQVFIYYAVAKRDRTSKPSETLWYLGRL